VRLPGNVSHDTLVAALGRQDRKDRFDSLGLPVELRNLVYEGLLVDKRERRVQASTGLKARHVLPLKCHRQILATNRRTYKEAKAVFVSENKGLCLFSTCRYGAGAVVTEAHLEDRCLISDDAVDSLQSWTQFSRVYQFNYVHLAVKVGCYCHSQPLIDEADMVDLVKWLCYFDRYWAVATHKLAGREEAASTHIPGATWKLLAYTCSLIFRKGLTSFT